MQPYYNLSFKSSVLLNPEYTLPEFFKKLKWHNTTVDPSVILSEEFIEELKSYGFVNLLVKLFIRQPGTNPDVAHVDFDSFTTEGERNIHAINMVLGGEDSKMIWYENPENQGQPLYSRPLAYTLSWPRDSLSMITSRNIGTQPVLVRTDIPHCVDSGSTLRWCVSIRYDTTDKDWGEVTNRYADLGLLSP